MIHCFEHTERISHMKMVQQMLDQPLRIFKGLFCKYLPISNQVNYIHGIRPYIHVNKQFEWGGQVGCYLSHYLLLEHIMNQNIDGYSVIFEDDVIIPSNLHHRIQTIIDTNVPFDMIFLGNFNENHGNLITHNVYKMNSDIDCWGTHALLINNAHISKIYKLISTIESEIDCQYTNLIKSGKINGYVIYPSLCIQNKSFCSSTKNTRLMSSRTKPSRPSFGIVKR